MAVQVHSIGTRSAENVDITNATGSNPYTVTLAGATTSTDVGDELFDEHATPRSYLITAVAGASLTVIDTEAVGSAPDFSGTTQAKTERYYSAMQGWEDDINNTTYPTASTDAKGECHNDTNFNEDVTINANPSNVVSITLSVASGERHTGIKGTGARLVASTGRQISLAVPSGYDQKYILEWLEIDENGQSQTPITVQSATAGNTPIIRNCIVHDVSGGGGFNFLIASDRDARVVRNIFYDLSRDSTGEIIGLRLDADRTQGGCFGNTVYKVDNPNATGSATGIKAQTNSANHQNKNNISMFVTVGGSGTALDFNFAGTNIDSETNMSEDPSADDAGGTHQISKDRTTQFISTVNGSENFHLVSGSNAIDNGTDLGNTLSGAEIDIDGFNCHTDTSRDPWDIGAHEFDNSSGGIEVLRRRRDIVQAW